ncbi:MAG: phosphocholine cytidylyltransferase family protein [Gammaproteobacteria bacterium]|nr:phosphocholine cytidylyltransferase family protein [Gammaproteobacteria bacterium]
MIRAAVILAAGMGTRLSGELEDRPKGFLELGGEPIIIASLRRLAAAGIETVVVVTGHCASYYESLAADSGGFLRTVHNDRFADSGSMYSLYCARDLLDGDFLLLESDLIYEPRALEVLLAAESPDAILLSGPTNAGDEVYVETRDGQLVAMSKDRDALGGVAGELVGISRISGDLVAIMCRIAATAFESSLFFDYETDCLVAAAAERRIACPVVPDLAWAEIDDPDHLQRARDQVYPRIQAIGAG